MIKYFVLLILLSEVTLASPHTLITSNLEATKAMSAILDNNCSITDRLNDSNDFGDIVIVVTVVCKGSDRFTQYIMNVYETINGESKVTTPFVVGTKYDFNIDAIKINSNIVTLTGMTWAKIDAHCCPSIPAKRIYVLDNHMFFSVREYNEQKNTNITGSTIK